VQRHRNGDVGGFDGDDADPQKSRSDGLDLV
jgi:hypothetical protein